MRIDRAKDAFVKLKTIVTSPLVLTLPDFSKYFIIECDALGEEKGQF
jgi:hypothetical protein